MMRAHEGIVLKNYQPKKNKISLLDEHLGRIESFAPFSIKQPLHVGSLVRYFPVQAGSLYQLEGIQILEVPLELARSDIYFFHRVIELCYYFLPLEAAANDTFNLVKVLLNSNPYLGRDLQKKLFLLRFFVELGMYPEEDFPLGESLHYLLSQPIEVMLKKKIKISEQELERWLLSCIEAHPQKAKFKTMVVGCENGIF